MSDSFISVVQCNMENWKPELFRFSIPTYFIKLTAEESNAILSIYEGKQNQEVLSSLIVKIDEGISRFPDGVFIKLGSRSPKDSFIGFTDGFNCRSGKQAIRLLCDSERIRDDLYLNRRNDYPTTLVLRKWAAMYEEKEFRCFYKDRKLVGISQYAYLDNEYFPWIVQHAGSIQWGIEMISDKIAPYLPADDVIADYVVDIKEVGPGHYQTQVKLIECNPFNEDTDPCLFCWRDDKFHEFEFRYIKEHRQKVKSNFEDMFLIKEANG